MAIRPVYIPKESAPFYAVIEVDFEWNGGFAASQKQKNIRAIHEAFHRRKPGKDCLEISSKSLQEGGVALSAFNLTRKGVPVECVFQAGKVFEKGGPFTDLMSVTPREAKRDERLKASGRLLKFTCEGIDFPLIPRTLYYDWLYIGALREHPELAEVLLKYDGFTDVEFNPDKSINCQAKAAAVFVSLTRLGLIDKTETRDGFMSLYDMPAMPARTEAKREASKPEGEKPAAKPMPAIRVGGTVKHKVFGAGTVLEANGGSLRIAFPGVGEKKLGEKWCRENCEIVE